MGRVSYPCSRKEKKESSQEGIARTIETSQELSNDATLHFALRIFTFAGDGVDLIDKQDARCCFLFVQEEKGREGSVQFSSAT